MGWQPVTPGGTFMSPLTRLLHLFSLGHTEQAPPQFHAGHPKVPPAAPEPCCDRVCWGSREIPGVGLEQAGCTKPDMFPLFGASGPSQLFKLW